MSMLSRAKYQNYWFYCDRVTPICLVNTADFRSGQYCQQFPMLLRTTRSYLM